MERFHQHNEIEFGILDSGSHEAYFGGQLRRIPTRRVACGWAMIPHRALGGDCTSYLINLPLPWFLSRGLPAPFVEAMLHGTWFFDPRPDNGEDDVRRFVRWHGDINGDDERRRSAALLEIEARLLRLALELECAGALDARPASDKAHAESSASAAELGKVEQMAAYIATHYRSKLKMEEVARDVGLHPKYAMQLFRRSCGITLWHYLTQQRLWHAQRLLATGDLAMVEVAREAGFGSDSQFYATFKRHCGVSPREYRTQVAGR